MKNEPARESRSGRVVHLKAGLEERRGHARNRGDDGDNALRSFAGDSRGLDREGEVRGGLSAGERDLRGDVSGESDVTCRGAGKCADRIPAVGQVGDPDEIACLDLHGRRKRHGRGGTVEWASLGEKNQVPAGRTKELELQRLGAADAGPPEGGCCEASGIGRGARQGNVRVWNREEEGVGGVRVRDGIADGRQRRGADRCHGRRHGQAGDRRDAARLDRVGGVVDTPRGRGHSRCERNGLARDEGIQSSDAPCDDAGRERATAGRGDKGRAGGHRIGNHDIGEA